MNKILLVDDDRELTSLLKELLEMEGFNVLVAHDGEQALELLDDSIDLLLLDVMMPKKNGIDTLKALRQTHQTPVIMLTARGSELDRVLGLELGADDYLPKPFNDRELVARIRAILRRSHWSEQQQSSDNGSPTLEVDALSLNPGRQEASFDGQTLERIETEAQRLDSMINDLLVMSRNQQKNALVSETMKANQLWGEVLDNAAFEAEQMGKSLTVNYPPGPWPLYGNPNALESALENIVRNALRYSHTKIEVGFSVDKDGITITVDDDGPGVSPEDREQIFRPFYRTDEARDRESGGTGLGLAIVESAMQQHRGWVKADDSPLGGLRLTLWLPLYKRT